MALLKILKYPDPRLRKIAQPVETVDEGVRSLVSDMFETMYEAGGIGLAATQVNVHRQIIVMDLSEEKDRPMVFINPVIEPLVDNLQSYDEGCLSVPGFYESVKRPEKVLVRAMDKDGEAIEMLCENLLAVCIQHEMDHLNGKLFVDHISRLKRDRIRKKLERQSS
jgi:peptide deformylase